MGKADLGKVEFVDFVATERTKTIKGDSTQAAVEEGERENQLYNKKVLAEDAFVVRNMNTNALSARIFVT